MPKRMTILFKRGPPPKTRVREILLPVFADGHQNELHPRACLQTGTTQRTLPGLNKPQMQVWSGGWEGESLCVLLCAKFGGFSINGGCPWGSLLSNLKGIRSRKRCEGTKGRVSSASTRLQKMRPPPAPSTIISFPPIERWFLFPTNLLGHSSSFREPFRILATGDDPFREPPRCMFFIVSFRKPSAAHVLQDLLPRVLAQKGKSF